MIGLLACTPALTRGRAPSWRTIPGLAGRWSPVDDIVVVDERATRGADSSSGRSGRSAVLVDQTTEAIDTHDRSGGVTHPLKGDRRIEVDAPVGPGLVVMGHELHQHPLQGGDGQR